MAELNIIAKMPDHDLWMSFFRDMEGNAMALMCEVRFQILGGGQPSLAGLAVFR